MKDTPCQLGIHQPSADRPSEWKHHWGLCPGDNMVTAYTDPVVEIKWCRGCPRRLVTLKWFKFVWPLNLLVEAYGRWRVAKVFGECILWERP